MSTVYHETEKLMNHEINEEEEERVYFIIYMFIEIFRINVHITHVCVRKIRIGLTSIRITTNLYRYYYEVHTYVGTHNYSLSVIYVLWELWELELSIYINLEKCLFYP